MKVFRSMGILSRRIFRDIFASALLGTLLFSFVLFLRSVSKLFEVLVRSSAPPITVGKLFLLILPQVLTFTLPIGVLIGALLVLSRMSGDAEITAMRAGGVPSRSVLTPVVLFGIGALLLTTACTTWLTPWSIRQQTRIINQMLAAQLTAEIEPRVFAEEFERTILYVGDVVPGSRVLWRKVFMADLTDPKDRKGSQDTGDAPVITSAAEAIAVPDVKTNQIQLTLIQANTYEVGKSANEYHKTAAPRSYQNLDAQKPNEYKSSRPYVEMDMGPLLREARTSIEARIELHQRLALPLACLLFALLAVPLGVSSRKGGKSGAVVLTVLLALVYWTSLISLIGLAKERRLPAGLAVWTPNFVLLVAAVIFLVRLERPGDRDLVGALRGAFEQLLQRLAGARPGGSESNSRSRWPVFAQIVDTYVLSSFLYYFFLMLCSFVLMTEVFNFFELLGDMLRNHIPMTKMLSYLFFLGPMLIYDTAPLSVLVAVLVTFGVLSKQNEITAFKACGVSLHRLAVPVLLVSGVVSVSLFAFDHYVVPEANQKQDNLRREIKGRPPQNRRRDTKWILAQNSRIYYYKHFEEGEDVMAGVSVYELDPATFRLRRHIQAERARWEPNLHRWVFLNGWVREVEGQEKIKYASFEGQTATFPELNEPPSYFLQEVRQERQMNTQQLAAYIHELRQSGFNTVRLQVQFYKKFAVPLFAFIMAMLSIPFAFATGNRGAMAGVGVSFGIAMVYWLLNSLFEQVGNVNLLPSALAAWAPDAIFSLAGTYLLARMRT